PIQKSIVDTLRRIHYTRYERRVLAAQKRDRPDLPLSGWHHLNLAKKFDLPPLEDKMPRVDGSTLSVEEFREKYEQPRIPCMITGLTETWAAHENWKIDKLLEKYANATFKCGESPNAKPVYMKFKYYAEYMRKNKDDSPLYIFDGKFGRRHATMDMVNDYEVPPYFRGNLFEAFGSYKRKPLFRWIVIGPARSGTNIHIDPLGTSAWNALIHGHKRWVFIHPDAPRDLVRIPKDQRGIHAKEAVTWFSTVYKRIYDGDWPFDKYPVIECRQNPGETVFVPCGERKRIFLAGWWHVVINEDDTVAVTQNFCSITNLIYVYPTLVKQKPRLAQIFYERLAEKHPELLDIINKAMLDPKPIANGYDTSDESGSEEDEDDDSDDTISLYSTDVSCAESRYSAEVEYEGDHVSEESELEFKTKEEMDHVSDDDKESVGLCNLEEKEDDLRCTSEDSESEASSEEYGSDEENDENEETSEDEDVILKMPMR
ncbi:JmjC domain protein, partial [Ostertagia ostertagi]